MGLPAIITLLYSNLHETEISSDRPSVRSGLHSTRYCPCVCLHPYRQNAALILAGLVLGGRRGLYVGLLFLVLGLALPVLAGGGTTLRALAGPTAGYIIGYVLSPAITGLIAYRAPRKKAGMAITFIIAAFVGLAVQYICGSFGLMVRSGLELAPAFAAQIPFLLPDSAKIVVAIIIALGVHAAFPDLISRKRKTA